MLKFINTEGKPHFVLLFWNPDINIFCILSLFVSFIFLVLRRKRQYSNHEMFQKLENWIYFKSSSKECHQCTMFLSTVFVDFLNLKLCLLIIYSPLDTAIKLKYFECTSVDIFIFFNVFIYYFLCMSFCLNIVCNKEKFFYACY